MKKALIILLICFAFTASAKAGMSYDELYLRYLHVIRFSSNPQECLSDIDHYATSNLTKIKIKIKEKRAIEETRKICSMPLDDVFTLAENYANGTGGLTQNKDKAIYLFFHLYFGHDNQAALYRLKDLGADVVTEPPTKEEMEAIKKEIEEIDKNMPTYKKNLENNKDYYKSRPNLLQLTLNYILTRLFPAE